MAKIICKKCKKEIENQNVGYLHLHWEGNGEKVEPRDEYFCSYNCLSSKYY